MDYHTFLSIMWASERCMLFYYDVNIFCTFHIIFTEYFFNAHSANEHVMSSIHNKWITNDCWIPSALILIVSCVIGVMICSDKQITTEKW